MLSSNVERYFVDLAAKADDAVLRTLEHKTLADSLGPFLTCAGPDLLGRPFVLRPSALIALLLLLASSMAR